jgi:hypothetical protein
MFCVILAMKFKPLYYQYDHLIDDIIGLRPGNTLRGDKHVALCVVEEHKYKAVVRKIPDSAFPTWICFHRLLFLIDEWELQMTTINIWLNCFSDIHHAHSSETAQRAAASRRRS